MSTPATERTRYLINSCSCLEGNESIEKTYAERSEILINLKIVKSETFLTQALLH